MSIVREIKWALLELFPEQKETEAAAEQAAWSKAREEEAEAAAKAEAETKEKEAAAQEGAEKSSPEASEEPSAAEEETTQDESVVEPEPVAVEPYDPEVHDVPFSEVPEGDRPNGVMVLDYSARGVHLDVQCSPDQVVDTAKLLDENGFCLEAISGVDWMDKEQMEVLYDYSRTDGQFCRVVVRVQIPRSDPSVPSVSDIYPGANWHERETHEFFGIKFEGHPYLVPLLLPEDADFHPLLKDFTP